VNSADMTKLAIAAGILYAAYKFVPNQAVKAMALGAAGVVVAKQLPYVKDVI
jgi:hypothetical protein